MENLVSFYKRKEKTFFYAASFLMPLILTLILFAVREIYPFGDVSFLKKDMYQQYTPFFYEFCRKLKAGDSLWYSWNAGIGANFLAVIAYYLASPFNFLCALFPERYILEFMTYSVVIKTGLMGLTMSTYLSWHFKTRDIAIPFFGTAYAMSAFMAAYSWNVEWMDVLFVAPLCIMGLEKLVNNESGALFSVSLSYSILSNYYLSIMLCIYLLLYFIVLQIINGMRIKSVIRFLVFSILSGGVGAVFILPELHALKFTTFTNIRIPVELRFYYNPLELFSRHLCGIETETGLEHSPNIYCGILIVFLIVLYAASGKIALKEKICKLSLMLFFLLSFDTNILNFIWHGFNYPDSLPARQGYLYIILILTMGYEAFLCLRSSGPKAFYPTLIIPVVLIEAACFLVQDEGLDAVTKIYSMVFMVSFCLLFYLYRSAPDMLEFPGNRQETIFRYSILAFFAFEIVLNMYYTNNRTIKRSEYFSKYDDYKILNEEMTAQNEENDSLLNRADEVSRNVRNDSMMIDYSSLSNFSSTTNGLLIKYADKYGLMNSRVFYLSDGTTYLTSLLMGQKYILIPKDRIYPGEDIAKPVMFSNGAALYEFNSSIPNGYVIRCNDETKDKLFLSYLDAERIIDSEIDPPNGDKNPIEAQNTLMHDLNMPGTLFLQYGSPEAGTISKADKKISVSFMDDCHLYAYNPSKTNGELKISMSDGSATGEIETNKYKFIIDLGYHPEGTTATFTSEDDEDSNIDMEFFKLNASVVDAFASSLNESETLKNIERYDDHLTGGIDMTSPGHLVLTVPYEPGWTLTIDGQETHIDLFDGLWISAALSEGHHDIRIDFYPKGLNKGILISLVSVVLIALILWYERILSKRSHHRSRKGYTEDPIHRKRKEIHG